MRPRSEVADEEATQYPIFLLQSARVIVLAVPEGYYHDGEGFRPSPADDAEVCGPPRCEAGPDETLAEDWEYLTNQELLDLGEEIAMRTWNTELVFADRGEAEEYARGRSYNYPDGWRVYCVPCKGSLATALETVAP